MCPVCPSICVYVHVDHTCVVCGARACLSERACVRIHVCVHVRACAFVFVAIAIQNVVRLCLFIVIFPHYSKNLKIPVKRY
jgi:hypothetical protein